MHMGLELSVHQATQSKELVNLLNVAGHCVSYDVIRRIYTPIAKKVKVDLECNEHASIPMNVNKNMYH